MGFLVFLLIVACIVVPIVIATKHKHKKAVADLENSSISELALIIKDEFVKRGGEDFNNSISAIFYGGYAWARVSGYITDHKNPDYKYEIKITISEYMRALDSFKSSYRYSKITELKSGYLIDGIENENIPIMVVSEVKIKPGISVEESQRLSQNSREYLKIAADVIERNGNGRCNVIEESS